MLQNATKHNPWRFYWDWRSKASTTFYWMQLSPQYIDRGEKQVAFQQQFLLAFPSRTSSLSWGLQVTAIVRRGGPSGVTRWNQLQLGCAEKWWTSKAVTGNLPHKSRCPPPAARRRPTVPCAAAASSSSTRAVRRYDHIIISLHHGTRCLVLFFPSPAFSYLPHTYVTPR